MSGSNGNAKRREQAIETNPEARSFLAALAQVGNITKAAEIAGCSRQRHYQWLEKLEGYADAASDAMEQAADILEAEARRRAVEGCVKPVFYLGEPVGAVREYSDTLLIFLLKAARPEKFRDRYEVKNTGSVKIQVIDGLDVLADEEACRAIDLAYARRAAAPPMADPGSSRN